MLRIRRDRSRRIVQIISHQLRPASRWWWQGCSRSGHVFGELLSLGFLQLARSLSNRRERGLRILLHWILTRLVLDFTIKDVLLFFLELILFTVHILIRWYPILYFIQLSISCLPLVRLCGNVDLQTAVYWSWAYNCGVKMWFGVVLAWSWLWNVHELVLVYYLQLMESGSSYLLILDKNGIVGVSGLIHYVVLNVSQFQTHVDWWTLVGFLQWPQLVILCFYLYITARQLLDGESLVVIF